MRLVLDMNLPPRLGSSLSSAGHVVEHWSDIGAADAVDTEILRYAGKVSAVVLTHDLDFGSILAASGDTTPSVIIVRSDNLAVPGLAKALTAALEQFETDLRSGALLVIDPKRTRVRLLPLRPQ